MANGVAAPNSAAAIKAVNIAPYPDLTTPTSCPQQKGQFTDHRGGDGRNSPFGAAAVNLVVTDTRLDYRGGHSLRVDNYEIDQRAL
ncbi:hypothetical protein [Paraburkholderia sp. UCT2]|uniref:hypothetical protein n=1 Tax=Paraburkholderia sp. UCT2 TaxID=2615208 RepID=UPI00223C3D94|nr:hypothetical protein [Paraburkholderia sp. UCT2]